MVIYGWVGCWVGVWMWGVLVRDLEVGGVVLLGG